MRRKPAFFLNTPCNNQSHRLLTGLPKQRTFVDVVRNRYHGGVGVDGGEADKKVLISIVLGSNSLSWTTLPCKLKTVPE